MPALAVYLMVVAAFRVVGISRITYESNKQLLLTVVFGLRPRACEKSETRARIQEQQVRPLARLRNRQLAMASIRLRASILVVIRSTLMVAILEPRESHGLESLANNFRPLVPRLAKAS